MTEHIAILSHKSVLDKILVGEKTIESRFSRVKSLPFGQLAPEDIVYFKLSGGSVLGRARIRAVEEYDNLTPARIEGLARQYEQELALSVDFLARKLESKFASLIFLADVEHCEPWNYKQEGRSGWIVLAPGEIKFPIKLLASNPTLASSVEATKVADFRAVGVEN